MTQTERRRLLKNINRLVRQSSKADVKTMATVLNDLGALYSDLLDRSVVIVAGVDHPDNRAAQDKFINTVRGTNQEQGKDNE